MCLRAPRRAQRGCAEMTQPRAKTYKIDPNDILILLFPILTMSRPSNERTNSQLSEQLIQDSFHSYLKSSLTQAKAERLIDVDVLASAEGDLMITGA